MIFTSLGMNTFTTVEENFDFQRSSLLWHICKNEKTKKIFAGIKSKRGKKGQMVPKKGHFSQKKENELKKRKKEEKKEAWDP